MTHALNTLVSAQFVTPKHVGGSASILEADYISESDINAYLASADSTYYNVARLAQMSINDKIYALRIIDVADGGGTVTPPYVQFGYTVDGLDVVFDNNCYDVAGLELTYLWNFGDGYTSTEKDAANTYDNPGTYNVTLVATNSAGAVNAYTTPVTVTE